MIDSAELKKRIHTCGATQNKIAAALGISPSALSRKIHNKSAFTLNEAEEISVFLRICNADFDKYFMKK